MQNLTLRRPPTTYKRALDGLARSSALLFVADLLGGDVYPF